MGQELIDMLNKLTKEDLINIADQEKQSLEEKGITISKSWPKPAVINSLIAALDEKTIMKYVSIRMEVEEEIERTTVEKIKRKTKIKTNEVTLSKSELIINLVKLESSGLEKKIIFKEAKDQGYEIYDKPTVLETLEQYPMEFLFHLYNLWKKRRTGKGLEYRFAYWMKNNFREFEKIKVEKRDKHIKYRHNIRGHEIDIFSYIKRKTRGYSLIIVQCKDRIKKINKNDVSRFKGIVEDIANAPSIKSLKRVRFIIVSTSGFVQSAIDFSERNPFDKVGGKKAKGVFIDLYEETELGTFIRVFPTKK